MQTLEERRGILSCGCPVDVTLLDLYLWKTWSVHNCSGQAEGLHNQQIDTHVHLLIVEGYKMHMGLTGDDLYTNGKDECEAMKLCLHAQIAHLVSEYNSIAGFPRGKD